MLQPLRLAILMLIIFLTSIYYLWSMIVTFMGTPTLETFALVFLADKKSQSFSTYFIEKKIHSKKQIRIELDWEEAINEKKFEIIRYEARKLTYTSDTNTAVRVIFSKDVNYSTIIRLTRLCYEDRYRRWGFIRSGLVIWNEYSPREKKELSLPTLEL